MVWPARGIPGGTNLSGMTIHLPKSTRCNTFSVAYTSIKEELNRDKTDMVYSETMDTIELRDEIATVTLIEAEVKLLCIMAQYWIQELPSESALAKLLSEQLRELASKFELH